MIHHIVLILGHSIRVQVRIFVSSSVGVELEIKFQPFLWRIYFFDLMLGVDVEGDVAAGVQNALLGRAVAATHLN